MGKPKAPQPPDPRETAGAQTATNIGTAIANAQLGLVNQTTPYGSLRYQTTGPGYSYTDPNNGQTHIIPQFEAVQTLSPEGQTIQGNQMAADMSLSETAKNQAWKISDLLGTNLNFNGLPQGGNAASIRNPNLITSLGQPSIGLQSSAGAVPQMQTSIGQQQLQTGLGNAGPIQGSIGDGGPIQRQIGDGGAITRTYGTDFSEDRRRVEDALMSRLNPSLDRDREALRTSLINQGLTEGSEAFDRAMNRFGEQSNDARMQAILAGGQEQSRLVGLEANRAGFQNAAQNQAFGQGLARGQFANAAQDQAFGQGLTQGQFANAAQGQGFGQLLSAGQFGNDARMNMFGQGLAAGQFGNQAAGQQFDMNMANANLNNAARGQQFQEGLTSATFGNTAAQQQMNNDLGVFNAMNQQRGIARDEAIALRNQPLNEITALLSGSQVQQPNFVNTPMPQIPTTDYAGLVGQNYAAQMANFNQQNAARGQMMGGILGLGAGALGGAGAAGGFGNLFRW